MRLTGSTPAACKICPICKKSRNLKIHEKCGIEMSRLESLEAEEKKRRRINERTSQQYVSGKKLGYLLHAVNS